MLVVLKFIHHHDCTLIVTPPFFMPTARESGLVLLLGYVGGEMCGIWRRALSFSQLSAHPRRSLYIGNVRRHAKTQQGATGV